MPVEMLRWSEPGATSALAARLQAGEVWALPTETLYGLSCQALDAQAVARIAVAKRIGAPRGFVALVADAEAALRWATRIDARGAAFLRATWPTALTAVVGVDAGLPWAEAGTQGPTAAFRVPAHSTLLELLERLGAPLISTSANRTGEPPLDAPEEIASVFGAELDGVAIGPPEERPGFHGLPSTVADFTAWPPRLLRPGRFDLEAGLGAWSE